MSKKGVGLRQKAVSGIFWTFLQLFGKQGLGFFVSIALARILMPEDFGLIGMLSVFMAVGQSLIDSGLTQSIIRDKDPTDQDYSTVFFVNLIGSVLIYLLMYIGAPYIALFYKQEVLTDIVRIYCLSFVINAFSAVQFTRLTKRMDFKTQMLVTIPSFIIAAGFGLYFAYTGYGVWSLVYMNLIQSLASTIQVWVRSKWSPSFAFDKGRFMFHFSFGYKLTLSGLLNTIFSNIYTIVIGRFFSVADVGFYNRANTLKSLPVTNISSALNKVTYPLFAEIQDDDIRLKRAYKQIMQMVLFIIAPVLLFLGALADPFFRLVFTEKWLPAVPMFQIMCCYGIFYPIHSYNLNIVKVKGRPDLFLKLEIIKKIITTLTLLVTLHFGIIAMLWGAFFSSVMSLFVNSYYSGRFINYSFREQLKDISLVLILAVFSAGVIWGVDMKLSVYSISDLLRLLIGGIIGLFVYLGGAYLFKVDSLNQAKKIIFKR